MLRLEHVSLSYDKPIFKNVDLHFPDTSLFCIHGKSGSGKTTLLNLLTFETPMQEGKIFYNEEEITENNKDDFLFYHVSYIDQDGQYLKNMTIYQHFEFYARLHHLSIDKELVKKYLDKVHLENIEIKKYPSYLSTGQRKRFLIALALMMKKDILILDEPTASLDTENKEKLIEVLKELSKDVLVVCTTHDEMILEAASQVCKIENYQINFEKTMSVIQKNEDKSYQKINKLHYFKYKNIKNKILYIIFIVIGLLSTVFISYSLSQRITLNLQTTEYQNSLSHNGLIYYKLPDARYLDWETYDFIENEDLKMIQQISGVQSITPYYNIKDFHHGEGREFTLTSKDGVKKKCSYYWPRQSKNLGIDFYAKIVIFSYDSTQHIQSNGKNIQGTYIDENFAELIDEDVTKGGTLDLDFYLPTEYFEHYTTIEGVEDQLREYQFKDEKCPLSIQFNGVLNSDVYSDSDSSTEGNYVKIFMPVDQVREILKSHAKSENHIYKHPMTYLIMCKQDQKDNVKVAIEQANELYRVRFQDNYHYWGATTTMDSLNLVMLFACMSMVLACCLLSYYQLYLRKSELKLLRREGLSRIMKKYYMEDFWIFSMICLLASILALGILTLISGGIFAMNILFVSWIGISVIYLLVLIGMGYFSYHLIWKRVMTYD
ncbi:ATP-binding cassette domain-containing protein [Longibaculum muris]|uniref:ATP-binding cassette domain-containing protein n=1 Tax=Longibaculum muris TaxID=1796628 RepID=UPI0018A02078|nr:ATP-binding cassette domain-containing protein [Longibaculum muris]